MSSSPPSRKDVTSSLAQLPKTVRARGLELYVGKRVKSCVWDRTNHVLSGTVRGTHLYHQVITFSDGEVNDMECSCPYEYECKHAVALLHQAMSLGIFPESGPGHETPQTPLIAIQPKTPAAPSEPSAPLGPLAQTIAKRSGGNLHNNTRAAAALVQGWWDKKVKSVPRSVFVKLAGASYSWQSDDTSLYPAPDQPGDAWELLHAVASKAEDLRVQLPVQITKALDADLVDRFRHAWRRETEELEWRVSLARWAREAPPISETAVPEFRLRLHSQGGIIEWRPPEKADFTPMKMTPYRSWAEKVFGGYRGLSEVTLSDAARQVLWAGMSTGYPNTAEPPTTSENFRQAVVRLVSSPEGRAALVCPLGDPIPEKPDPLRWELKEAPGEKGSTDYHLALRTSDGQAPPAAIAVKTGVAPLYISPTGIWRLPSWPLETPPNAWPLRIPGRALETNDGATLLSRLGVEPPPRLAEKIVTATPTVTVVCEIRNPQHGSSCFGIEAHADFGHGLPREHWNGGHWTPDPRSPQPPTKKERIVVRENALLHAAHGWIMDAALKRNYEGDWEKRITRGFPDEFLAWMARRPAGIEVELDPELASLRDGPVSARVSLDIEESGIDWFDLKVALSVDDTTLTPDDVALLLKAKGKWVRLTGKGWRRLDYDISEAEQAQLAAMGLTPGDFDGTPQRLHALQLAAGAPSGGGGLLPGDRVETLRRRAEEIQTRVTPPVPEAITAQLRPYQEAGFHFLAYLTANRFGGVLADDMGLGKTLQTLTWLAWVREQPEGRKGLPSLVICPKSVQDNWMAEAARFHRSLRVVMWDRLTAGDPLPEDCDLLIIHYQQLRLHADLLTGRTWEAVILDEAQAIKNPNSSTAHTACRLKANHRLALTGTPIENRLLDLWSIMAFAMPGVLGNRAWFARTFDNQGDPFARLRLSARVRPFLLRRTKAEVATDLPDRIEEDLSCELEGVQEKLYKAELKKARAQLLNLKTPKQLDKARFHVLTNLLRLRQICCHPSLVGSRGPKAESAKLGALVELLEPLMEEGHKVLVFSQFVEMIRLIQEEIAKREWPCFVLTGETDHRGDLVRSFQESEGAGVFLISLKAGGSGLNLTAASYAVIFDPWWNPAVEAQAIDRTHRIGQTRTVIAYRLIVKDTIEEKIRQLQRQKGALANDVLGEESFAQALTLSDFNFLLGEDPGE